MSISNSKSNNKNGYVTDYEDIDDILSEVDKLRLFSISSQNNFINKEKEDNLSTNNSDKKLNLNFGENLSKMIIKNRLKKREEELLYKNIKGEKIVSKNTIDFKKYLNEEEYKIRFTEIGNSIMDSILSDD